MFTLCIFHLPHLRELKKKNSTQRLCYSVQSKYEKEKKTQVWQVNRKQRYASRSFSVSIFLVNDSSILSVVQAPTRKSSSVSLILSLVCQRIPIALSSKYNQNIIWPLFSTSTANTWSSPSLSLTWIMRQSPIHSPAATESPYSLYNYQKIPLQK